MRHCHKILYKTGDIISAHPVPTSATYLSWSSRTPLTGAESLFWNHVQVPNITHSFSCFLFGRMINVRVKSYVKNGIRLRAALIANLLQRVTQRLSPSPIPSTIYVCTLHNNVLPINFLLSHSISSFLLSFSSIGFQYLRTSYIFTVPISQFWTK